MMDEDAYESLDIELRQAYERIAQLEAALVEQTARAIHAERHMDDYSWPYPLDKNRDPEWREGHAWARDEACEELEESGILTKLQNGAK